MRSGSRWVERRELFAEGVASGNPGPDSVVLWTRASAGGEAAAVPLTVEVAEDPGIERVVATAPTVALLAADHTCRVLVSRLRPARTYWHRFMDESSKGRRIGRTRTAPTNDDPRPARMSQPFAAPHGGGAALVCRRSGSIGNTPRTSFSNV